MTDMIYIIIHGAAKYTRYEPRTVMGFGRIQRLPENVTPTVCALSKGHTRKRPGKVSVPREAPKRRKLVRRKLTDQQCNKLSWDGDFKEQLYRTMERISNRIFRKLIKLHVER
jgi:hypothetical protein